MIAILTAATIAVLPVQVTVPGLNGPLSGTLTDPGGRGPAIVILPGSGPTDRDGNNALGVLAAPYRMLAEALASRGIATLRADKRGMFASKSAVADANAVTIGDYATDAHAWVDLVRQRTGRSCAWLLGHSEGGLIALAAAQKPRGICGVILVAAPGRPLADVLRAQLKANTANAPILDAALGAIDALAEGRRIDPATLPVALQPMFGARIQGFLIDVFAQRPARDAAALTVPLLVMQGDHDLQVSMEDAHLLADADPKATLAIIPGMNHVLKIVAGNDRAANLATYKDSSLPLAPGVVDRISRFVIR